MKKIILILLIVFPLSSQAIVEIRGGYGLHTPDEDRYTSFNVDKMKGLNIDVLFMPPMITNLGFGLRHEMLDGQIGNTDTDLTRTSLLINYRFIDTALHVGIVGSYAISEKLESSGNPSADAANASYTIGAEALVTVGPILTGIELGKMFAKYEMPLAPDLELDNIYIKFLVGISI